MGIVCQRCGIEQNENRFTTRKTICDFCVWYKRKGYVAPDNWSEQDVSFIMRNLYYQDIVCLNDFVPIINRDVNEIMSLIHNHFKINNMGSKKISVRCNCAECGKEVNTFVKKALNQEKLFCSHPCYAEYLSKHYFDNRQPSVAYTTCHCDYCGNEMKYLTSQEHKLVNKLGESHHFCCHDCYAKFRSEYYRGDKLYNTGKVRSDETRQKLRAATLRQYATGSLNRQTKPQRIVNDLLHELKLSYQNEYVIKYYAVDNYLTSEHLIIEVMGDYFHSNPTIYDLDKIDKIQQKDLARDKRKRTYILKYCNIPILYLWEHDILHYPYKCRDLIKAYVANKGNLTNYQSYNYQEDLSLNPIIINPYFIENP